MNNGSGEVHCAAVLGRMSHRRNLEPAVGFPRRASGLLEPSIATERRIGSVPKATLFGRRRLNRVVTLVVPTRFLDSRRGDPVAGLATPIALR